MSVRKLAAVVAAFCAALLLVPVTAGAQDTMATQATSLKNIPITGTARNGKKFTGTFTVNRFVGRQGQPYAVGTLVGKVGRRSVKRTGVALPVKVGQNGGVTSAQAGGSCPILHLELGPLDLNLLGLKVHLNRVVLDITAQRGPGNLLGNLLCSIAGLLDQNPALPLSQLTALLNVLNTLLNNLAVLNL